MDFKDLSGDLHFDAGATAASGELHDASTEKFRGGLIENALGLDPS